MCGSLCGEGSKMCFSQSEAIFAEVDVLWPKAANSLKRNVNFYFITFSRSVLPTTRKN